LSQSSGFAPGAISTIHVSGSVGVLGQDGRRFRDWKSSDMAFLTINNVDPMDS
jgi:hypothetical protein